MDQPLAESTSDKTFNTLADLHILCSRCSTACNQSQILKDVPGKYYSAPHHPITLDSGALPTEPFWTATREELEQSSTQGCHLCTILLTRASTREWKRQEARVAQKTGKTPLYVVEIHGQEAGSRCFLNISTQLATRPDDWIEIRAGTDIRGPPREPFGKTTHPGQRAYSTRSTASMELAQSWITKCQQSHVQCTQDLPSDKTFSPTRLVDVSCNPPKLHITANSSTPVDSYLTLSHSWGKRKIFCMVTSNIDDLTKAINLDDLTPNFRDAIEITRRLGYRFIWIDSLCIIQDSADDWKAEAGKMSEVYRHSTCTIAATGEDSYAGCFRTRDPLLRRPCRLLTVDGEEIYAHPYGPSSSTKEDSPLLDGITREPLLKRAWVVQERLLSKRMLYFGLQGLLWECCTAFASEFWPDGSPINSHFRPDEIPIKFGLAEVLRHQLSVISEGWSVSSSSVWNSVVGTYTSTQLTYFSDRVVALAGIASVFQRATSMTYLAGLWLELMPENLLWRSLGRTKYEQDEFGYGSTRSQPDDMPTFHNKPTWSWIRHDMAISANQGPIEKEHKDLQVDFSATVNVSTLIYPSHPILGEVDRCELTITAPLCEMYWGKRNDVVYTDKMPNANSIDYSFFPDIILDRTDPVYFLLLRQRRYKCRQNPPRSAEIIYEEEILQEGLIIIPVKQERLGPVGKGEEREDESVNEGKYMRVGYLSNLRLVDFLDELPLLVPLNTQVQEIVLV